MVLRATLRQLQAEMRDEAPRTECLVIDLEEARERETRLKEEAEAMSKDDAGGRVMDKEERERATREFANIRGGGGVARPIPAATAGYDNNDDNDDVRLHAHNDDAIAPSRPAGTAARGGNPNGATYKTMAMLIGRTLSDIDPRSCGTTTTTTTSAPALALSLLHLTLLSRRRSGPPREGGDAECAAGDVLHSRDPDANEIE